MVIGRRTQRARLRGSGERGRVPNALHPHEPAEIVDGLPRRIRLLGDGRAPGRRLRGCDERGPVPPPSAGCESLPRGCAAGRAGADCTHKNTRAVVKDTDFKKNGFFKAKNLFFIFSLFLSNWNGAYFFPSMGCNLPTGFMLGEALKYNICPEPYQIAAS